MAQKGNKQKILAQNCEVERPFDQKRHTSIFIVLDQRTILMLKVTKGPSNSYGLLRVW